MQNIPDRFPARLLDRLVSCMGYFIELMIQLELQFGHRIDESRLERALDLVLDAEPVLGCRFVDHPKHPFWERLDTDHRKNFQIVQDEESFEDFRNTALDSTRGPQVLGCHWRRGEGDRLLIKVGHEVADAGAVKEISSTLSNIYGQLKDDPGYQPEPNISGSRSVRQILRHVPVYAYPKIAWNLIRENWRNTHPLETHSFDLDDVPFSTPKYILHHFPKERVEGMAEYGRKTNATLNDLLVAAYFRAQAAEGDWDGKAQLRLGTTVDTRRYLPSGRGDGICNLSTIEYNFLDRNLGDDFDATLARVAAFNNWRKARWIGLNAYVGGSPLFKFIPFHRQKKLFRDVAEWGIAHQNAANAITNMGSIKPEDVSLDGPPETAWLLVPPIRPPMLGIGVSGYNGTLTLSVGTYPEGMKQVDMVRVFHRIDSELPA